MDTPPPHHLYIVEDDASLREMLQGYFEQQGLMVTAMASAEEMLQRVQRLRPDLILLDIALPGMSGLEACQRLRLGGDRIPIILLTARGDEVDRVIGLEMGADDYVGKPFSIRELLARARSLLRRAAVPPGGVANARGTLRIGEHTFVAATRTLHKGQSVRVLSTVEYALLVELTNSPGVPVGRERLLAVSHARSDVVLLRAVDAAIMRLRKLLEPDAAVPRYIQTVRSQGYMFVAHDEQVMV
jgi:two-component system phosphate regulon response regulator OmpR